LQQKKQVLAPQCCLKIISRFLFGVSGVGWSCLSPARFVCTPAWDGCKNATPCQAMPGHKENAMVTGRTTPDTPNRNGKEDSVVVRARASSAAKSKSASVIGPSVASRVTDGGAASTSLLTAIVGDHEGGKQVFPHDDST